jgi:hypothetical protein
MRIRQYTVDVLREFEKFISVSILVQCRPLKKFTSCYLKELDLGADDLGSSVYLSKEQEILSFFYQSLICIDFFKFLSYKCLDIAPC